MAQNSDPKLPAADTNVEPGTSNQVTEPSNIEGQEEQEPDNYYFWIYALEKMIEIEEAQAAKVNTSQQMPTELAKQDAKIPIENQTSLAEIWDNLVADQKSKNINNNLEISESGYQAKR